MSGLAAGAAGLLVGWAESAWPAWALLSTRRSLEPAWSRAVGSGLRPAAAHVGWHRARYRTLPYAVHADTDGLRLHVLAGERPTRFPLFAAREPIATASLGSALVVAGADPDGVLAVALDPTGDAVGDPVRVVDRRDVAHLALVERPGGLTLVAALEGALEVVTLGRGLQIESRVRHSLGSPVQAMRAASAGNRVALALSYLGAASGEADLAILDSAGRMRERPHPLLRSGRGALRDARVHWDERGFRLSARDPAGRLLSRRSDGEPQVLFEDVGRPFEIAHRIGRTYVTTVEGATLRLRIREPDHLTHEAAVDLTTADRPRNARVEAIRALGDAWQRRGRSGYRGGAGAMRWSPADLEAVVDAPPRGVRARFEVGPKGDTRLRLVLGEPGVEAPETSWARLTAWLRTRLSRESAERRATLETLAAEVLGPAAERAELQVLGEAALITLPVGDLPTIETLDTWTRTLASR